MPEQEPRTQSLQVGWEWAAQPEERLRLGLPAGLSLASYHGHGPHSRPKPRVSKGCLPTHKRVSCFPHPWSLWGSSICHFGL